MNHFLNPAKVSVVVATFNRAHYIGECLDSLLAQTVPAHEIIVVDDGSKDDTRDVVSRRGSGVRYIFKENGGKPSAVNLGLSMASGDLVWIFDDDDVALPDAIQSRLASLRQVPEAGFVYSSHCVGTDGPDGRIARGAQYTPQPPDAASFFLELMKNCFFHLNSSLVRREHYVSLRGLDVALHSGEDYDFQIRLARKAIPAYCPTPSFIFRQHKGERGATAVRYAASERRHVFRLSSGTIGRKLRQDVALGEYLVPRQYGALDEASVRRALLSRVHVMANHGCVEELFADLRSLLALDDTKASLVPSERTAIAAAMRAGWAYEAAQSNWPHFVQQAKTLLDYRAGRSALLAVAKGIFGLAKGYPGSVAERAQRLRHATNVAATALSRP